MSRDKVEVVRVTATEFELSDGRVYQHPVKLEPDEIPTLEEFQEYYDYWQNLLSPDDDRKTTYNRTSL
ncbi:MAG: hypothetical protein F6K58_17205 [Symploca sp. SIO2E9]|nr:hypothetical protein [Symploca sp. SIO2E9]